jgi:hypothetical protein
MIKPMKNGWLMVGALILAALLGLGFWYSASFMPTLESVSATYSNQVHGFSFEYPKNYTLKENQVLDNPDRLSLSLIDSEALAQISENGEGPTAITVDVFPNREDTELKTWLEANSASNIRLSPPGVYATTTISGREAAVYTWDGLYQGLTIAIANRAEVMLLSVTYLTPEDKIKNDFAKVTASLKFQ